MRKWLVRWLDGPGWDKNTVLGKLRLFVSPEFAVCVVALLVARWPLQLLAGAFTGWLAPLPAQGEVQATAELLQRREMIGGIVEIAALVILFVVILLVGRLVRGKLGTRPLFLPLDDDEHEMEEG